MSIQRLPGKTLYGLEVKTTEFCSESIRKLWERFINDSIADEIPERCDENIVAAYHSFVGDDQFPCSYFLGCEVVDVACTPDGFVLRQIPVGNYAHFIAAGEGPESVAGMWENIQKAELRRSFGIDFEIHNLTNPRKVEIFVGVV